MELNVTNTDTMTTYETFLLRFPALHEQLLKQEGVLDAKLLPVSGTDLFYTDGDCAGCVAKVWVSESRGDSFPESYTYFLRPDKSIFVYAGYKYNDLVQTWLTSLI
jgi:hypothetical protein